jgi:hypothetical protein
MKFIQNSILKIDITSFILPEKGSIPGLRHLEIFLENFTKNVKPLYVVTAEMKRQQAREKNGAKQKKSKSSSNRQEYLRKYYQKNQQKIKHQSSRYYEANRDARLNSMRKYNHTHREENKQYHETNRDARLDSMKEHHEANRDARLDSMKQYHEDNRDARLDSMRKYNHTHREENKKYHEDNRDARLDSMKKYDNARREEKKKIESTRVNFTNTDSSHRIEMEPGEGVDCHFGRHRDCPEANTFLNHITTYKNNFTGNPESPHEFNILRNQIRAQLISAEKQRDVAQKFLLSQGRGCEWAEENLGKKMFVDGQSRDNLILRCACCGYRSLDNGYTKQPLSELSIFKLDEDETERHLKCIKEFNLVLSSLMMRKIQEHSICGRLGAFGLKNILSKMKKWIIIICILNLLRQVTIFVIVLMMSFYYNLFFQPPFFPGRSICMALSIMLEKCFKG